MKYSIIVVAYKAHEALHRCLMSLAENPPIDVEHEAELILVDNSPNKTDCEIGPELWKAILGVGKHPTNYLRFIHVWDGVNRGFAEGCNEGAKQAHGKTLIFINPDTIVFPGWVERMMAHMRPDVGSIGPISNYVAGYQNYGLHMQPCQDGDWAKTARMAAKGMAGRGVDTKLVIGFFFAIRREVWDKVGGLDPQFFLGCDDLDLSLRLRDAGYRMVIASDVFVYHEGHATFKAMGDPSIILNKQAEKKMLAKLAAKYPEGIPSSTELWGCEILPTYVPKRMTLSVCMIVRDEFKNLDELLPRLGFADEIVLVNTDPKAIIATHPMLIRESKYVLGDFPWNDSFSDARNYALSKCTGDYVLWLDADDRIPEESGKLIRAAFDNPGPLTQEKKCHFAMRLRDLSSTGRHLFIDHPRIFPRIEGLKWQGRVHERYMDLADKMGLKYVLTGIPFDHTGYKDPEVLKAKIDRNLRLLKMEEDSPMKFYHLANSYLAIFDLKEAVHFYIKTLTHKWAEPLNRDLVHHIRYKIALTLYKSAGKACPEMDEWLEGNEKPDALFLRAERSFATGNVDFAERQYRAYLGMGDIMDCFGTDEETFKAACEMRLDIIEHLKAESGKAVENVPA